MAADPAGMGVVSIPRRAGVVRSMRTPTGAARQALELVRRLSISWSNGGQREPVRLIDVGEPEPSSNSTEGSKYGNHHGLAFR